MIVDSVQSDVLQKAIESGMINLATLQMQIEMKEKDDILSKHQNKIWQDKKNRWLTYVPSDKEENERRLIVKNTKEDLEKAIVKSYKSLTNEPTVKKVFYSWLNQKMEYGEIQRSTYDRYLADYDRYIQGKEIEKTKIKDINELDLEDFIRKSIHEQQLTAKSWSNLRLLINGIFKYAKKHGFTEMSITNFMGDLDLSSKVFKKKTKLDELQVFNDSEVELLECTIKDKDVSLINLGIMLTFRTGLRVGELSALKHEDIKDNILYVRRTEISYLDGKHRKYEIRDFTKGAEGERVVILTEDAKNIIKTIQNNSTSSEFLFAENGERIKGKAFSTKLRRLCKQVKIQPRSMHKIRKTYATNLLNAGVDEKIIEKQMGHTDISTTKGFYYFNNRSIKETQDILLSATNY